MENSLHLYGISIALGVSLLAVLWGITFYFFLNALHKMKEAQAIIRRFHPLKNIYDTAPVHALVIHNQKISALNPKSSAYLGLEDIPSSPDIFFIHGLMTIQPKFLPIISTSWRKQGALSIVMCIIKWISVFSKLMVRFYNNLPAISFSG